MLHLPQSGERMFAAFILTHLMRGLQYTDSGTNRAHLSTAAAHGKHFDLFPCIFCVHVLSWQKPICKQLCQRGGAFIETGIMPAQCRQFFFGSFSS
jgi:hypothetical protein